MSGIRTRSAAKSFADTQLPTGTGAVRTADHRELVYSVLDSVVALGEAEVRVEDITRTTPPASPTNRQAHVIAAGATGDWLGKDFQIAIWDGSLSPSDWYYITPENGASVWNRADSKQYRFDTAVSPTGWNEVSTGGGGGSGTTRKRAVVVLTSDKTAQDYTSPTVIDWDSASIDEGSWWSSSPNPSRLTVPSGVTAIRLGVSIRIDAHTSGDRLYVYFNRSGAANGEAPFFLDDNVGTLCWVSLSSRIIDVSPGDYFEVVLDTKSDASVTLNDASSQFWIEEINPNVG